MRWDLLLCFSTSGQSHRQEKKHNRNGNRCSDINSCLSGITENSEHGCNDIRILITFFDDPDKCCYKYCQVRQQTNRTNRDKKLQVFIVGAVEDLMVYIGHNIHVVIISDKTEGVRPVSKQFVDRCKVLIIFYGQSPDNPTVCSPTVIKKKKTFCGTVLISVSGDIDIVEDIKKSSKTDDETMG